MKGLLLVLLLAVVGVTCVGFYRGWFRVGSDSAGGETNVTITVDQNKIKSDREKAVEKVRGIGENVSKEVQTPPPAQQPPQSEP